ncbi:hypothetical protein Pelo_18385 [Pelomyxa schiedti]|nr:hypothetical protein Pelo_18385 [Pelomyxa schiedti]
MAWARGSMVQAIIILELSRKPRPHDDARRATAGTAGYLARRGHVVGEQTTGGRQGPRGLAGGVGLRRAAGPRGLVQAPRARRRGVGVRGRVGPVRPRVPRGGRRPRGVQAPRRQLPAGALAPLGRDVRRPRGEHRVHRLDPEAQARRDQEQHEGVPQRAAGPLRRRPPRDGQAARRRRMKSHFSFDQQAVQKVATGTAEVESLMWLKETHGVQLTPASLSWLWTDVEGVESVEWFVKHLPMSVTAATFVQACGNIKDDLHCVRVLSQGVNLTPTNHEEALMEALYSGNIKIANWLEATFHVMEKNVNATAPKANSTLILLCKKYNNYCDTRAIRWFFEHVSADKIDESSLARAVRHTRFSVLSFLLELFHFTPTAADKQQEQRKWSAVLRQAVTTGWTPISSQIISCGAVDSSYAVNCVIQSTGSHFICGKAMKKLIREYHLEEMPELVKYNNNLLAELVHANKTRCAEWLIQNFQVTLEELQHHPNCINREISFPMWKMLLKVFPQITGEFLLNYLRCALMSSPIHIEFAMKAVGITQAQVMHLVTDTTFPVLPKETQLWILKQKMSRSHDHKW